MAGNKKGQGTLLRSVAVLLFLLSSAPGLSCFSFRGLWKQAQQEKSVPEATGNERTGRILFNGKELKFQSGSSSYAAKDRGLAHVDLPQSDGTGLPGEPLQLETAQEAAWKHLNPTLSCGQTKMKLKAMGPGAAGFQLDMGLLNGVARTLPLFQVPNSCGYSMRQNALGLILVVPYDGCSVIQENGYYVLPMTWLQNPVQLACPTSQSPDVTPTAQPTTETPVPTTGTSTAMNLPVNSIYQPYGPLYTFPWQFYNGQAVVPPLTFPTTTAQPEEPATTTTTPLLTTGTTPAMNPLANANYQYYYPMYPPLAWQNYNGQPMVQSSTAPLTTDEPTTAAVPDATTVTPDPTTENAPAVNLPLFPYYNYQNQNPYYWYDPISNFPGAAAATPPETTTASPTTAVQPPNPYDPSNSYYPPYYQYQPAGIPSQSQFYPFIQPQYPQNQNPLPSCSQQSVASASTPGGPNKMPSISNYQNWNPYSAYNWFPFGPYTWHRNKAEQFPSGWKYRSQAGYLPEAQAQAQVDPGYLYQQAVPWAPYSGQETSQFT